MAIEYLSAGQFAERIGVKRNTLFRYKLPPPDAMIGKTRGWLEKTIDDWQERRPGTRTTRDNERWNLPPELQ